MDCLFCKIAGKKIKGEIVWENNELMAFKDIHPLAPVHVLLIPKKHIQSLADIKAEDKPLIAEIFSAVPVVAEKLGIKERGFQVLVRTGKSGGQEVPHLHVHILQGTRF